MALEITELHANDRNRTFRVLGMMSGTSMDALDLCSATFHLNVDTNQWSGTLDDWVEVPLGALWPSRFQSLVHGSSVEWFECERDWTVWCAEQVRDHFNVALFDAVVFSGQTIFHRPNEGWTGQLGNGAALYALLGASTPVISNLRNVDVALGGQGAPLVPLADEVLFGSYEACLNLGGFANGSRRVKGERRAWDIAPCNLVFNALAQRKGVPFDDAGKLAASGTVIESLLEDLSALPFHGINGPKSLGVEWLEAFYWPVVKAHASDAHAVEDLLATHAAYLAAIVRKEFGGCEVLITGGGAFNAHLLDLLTQSNGQWINPPLRAVVPPATMIKGKEAYAFAFIGLWRALGWENVWKTVTGSSTSHLGGALWGHMRVSSPPPNAMK